MYGSERPGTRRGGHMARLASRPTLRQRIARHERMIPLDGPRRPGACEVMRRLLGTVLVLATLTPGWATAADHPVGGKLLRLTAPGTPQTRGLTFRAAPDPAIAAPFG